MKCIKDMTNLYSLNLAYNKFTKLAKIAFTKFKNLNYLDLSFNLLKKITPQVFAPANSLRYLYIGKLKSYNNVKSLLPNLIDLGLTVTTLNCSSIQELANVLNSQQIYLMYNSVTYWAQIPEGFTCQTNHKDMNKLKKEEYGRYG